MVFQKTLDDLRARPKAQRTAIATWISMGLVLFLFVCWLIYFFHSIETTPPPNLQGVSNSYDQSGLQNAQQQFQQALGSTTQFVEAQGSEELQLISTTSATTTSE